MIEVEIVQCGQSGESERSFVANLAADQGKMPEVLKSGERFQPFLAEAAVVKQQNAQAGQPADLRKALISDVAGGKVELFQLS